MAKSIWDQLGDFASGAVDTIGSIIGSAPKTIEQAFTPSNMYSNPQQAPSANTPSVAPGQQNPIPTQSPGSLPITTPQQNPAFARQLMQSSSDDSSNPSILNSATQALEGAGNNIVKTGEGFVKGAVSTGQKAINTLEVPVTGLVGEGMVAADKAFNGGQNAQNLENATEQQMNDIFNRKTVTGDQGTFISKQQALNNNNDIIGNFVKPVVATAGEILPYVAPYGDMAKFVAPAGDAAATSLLEQGINPTVANATKSIVNSATTGAINAPVMAASSAAQQYGTTGKINPQDTAQAALNGFLLAGGGHLLNDAAKGGTNAIVNRVNDITSQPGYNPEAGFAKVPSTGKLTIKSPSVADQAAETLGLSKADLKPVELPDYSERLSQIQPDKTKAGVALLPQEYNTAANPFKSELSDVNHGGYDTAITNAQYVHNDIHLAGQQWEKAMKNLTPEERSTFPDAVEHPELQNTYSPELKDAINNWKTLTDRIHGHSQALGGNTNYLQNYALHSWDLPEEYDTSLNGAGKNFAGLNNLSRKYRTLDEGRAAGLTTSGDPLEQGKNFYGASANALRKQALRSGFARADAGELEKRGNLQLGPNDVVPLSDKGMAAARGVQFNTKSKNLVIRGYRAANRGSVKALLSASGVHQYNVASRALPGLALEGHGSAAIKGLATSLRGDIPVVGHRAADKIVNQAFNDGTAAKASKIGMSYEANGKGLLYKQLTPIHDQVARSIISDLEKRNIPLNSEAARQAGKAGLNMMGEVNYELSHVNPKVVNALGDAMLAKQFTPSKFQRLGQAMTDFRNDAGGVKVNSVGGSYARRTMIGNALFSTAVITGLGYALGQKSDDIRDSLIRGLIDPAAATPNNDSKGNTIKVGLLGTDTSDIAKLIGLGVTRGKDGHLQVTWNNTNVPDNLKQYMTARLAPFLGDAVKVINNQNYAGKPLYDPQASLGDQAAQAATTLAIGHLPIAAQNLATSKAVQDVAPENVREVLQADANKDPLTNTLLSGTIGATEKTDQTTGKGLSTARYFTAVDKAKAGLNANDLAAFDTVNPQQKNPVTGQYQVNPTVFDKSEKAETYLSHPNVLQATANINKSLAEAGENTDPFWTKLNPDQQKKVLEYQTMAPGGPDATNWKAQNDSWYAPFEQQRATFFSSLPAGDPNKPQVPIQPPAVTPTVNQQFSDFNGITDASLRAKYVNSHPELSNYLDQYGQYVNQMRNAQGFASLRTFPKADNPTNSFMNTYFAADKNTQKIMRTSDPATYNKMQMYMAQVTRYGLDKAAGQDELVNPGQDQNANPSQTYLKDVSNMGKYDIAKMGSTYSLDPQAAYAQSKGYSFGNGGQTTAQKQQSRFVKAAKYESKIPNNSVRVMTPRKTMQISKAITSGIKPNKSAKGTLRIRRSMNRI